MAGQRVIAAELAEATLTHCPAELRGFLCPLDFNCIAHADEKGRLVECWVAVQHLEEAEKAHEREEVA
jgi:hypothetical protein